MNKTERTILKQLYRGQSLSRKDLADNLSLSKTIVGKYINNFLQRGYLEEEKNLNGSIGKPQFNLTFHKNFIKILALQLKGETIVSALGNFYGDLFDKKVIHLTKFSQENLLNNIFSLIESYINNFSIEVISIGMNGIVDSDEGISLLSIPYNWNNLNLKKILEEKFKISVVIDNGANLMALREKKIGLGKDLNNFIIFNIDEGVGAGIILNNKLHRGSKFEAGEIGHAPYDYSKDALICSCGNKGCLETYLSNWRVVNRVHKETNLLLSYEEIIQRANEGQEYFVELMFSLSKAISHGILWTEYLLNPEAIIITGKITEAKDFFWKEVLRTLNNNLLNKNKNIHLIKSTYSSNSILQGAIYSGADYFFK